MSQQRATWITKTAEPVPGTPGIVMRAPGFNDPSSVEHEAYLFVPDGQEDAFCCGESDFALA